VSGGICVGRRWDVDVCIGMGIVLGVHWFVLCLGVGEDEACLFYIDITIRIHTYTAKPPSVCNLTHTPRVTKPESIKTNTVLSMRPYRPPCCYPIKYSRAWVIQTVRRRCSTSTIHRYDLSHLRSTSRLNRGSEAKDVYIYI
jgi:hypothetical protein